MNKVYLTGSSLKSALGDNKFDAIKKLKTINNSNYKQYLKSNFEEHKFYKIKEDFPTYEEKFYSTIKAAVLDAIKDAGLNKVQKEELHIFIGSTSMLIGINEVENKKYVDKKTDEIIKEIGYGSFGSYIEDIVGSIYPSSTIHTACTSSVNALNYASELIKQGKIKRALILGLEFFNMSTYKGFESLLLLSQTGEYKPFDKNSDGLILGEGCSTVILDSEKRRDNDFEYISSSSLFDNYSITSSNPSGEVTLKCIKESLNNAKLTLEDLDCIKAHATGSENSNMSEANAIDKLFKEYNQKADVVILKPFIGHTLGACGTNEIVLLCECIKNGFIPKTLNFKETYEDIDFVPLLEEKQVDKATLLFQFIGFGGGNTSLILSNKS